jgi:uncharacterized protein
VLTIAVAVNWTNNRGAPHLYVATSLVGAAALLWIGRATGLSWRDLGLARETWRVGAVWAAVIIVVVGSVYAIAAEIPVTRELFSDDRVQAQSLGTLAFHVFVRIPFGTVVLEEVLFRGVLLALGARTMGWWRSAVLSSVLFGLWHILPAQGAAQANPAVEDVVSAGGGGTAGVVLAVVTSVVATALAGLVFCWLRIRSGSLFASMGLHWATNGLGYFFAALVRGGL